MRNSKRITRTSTTPLFILAAACSADGVVSPEVSVNDLGIDRASGPLLSSSSVSSTGTELLVNGSFETGFSPGWTASVVGNTEWPWTVSGAGAGSGFGSATQPFDGALLAWNGFDGTSFSSGAVEYRLSQTVTIPAHHSATLTWADRAQWMVLPFAYTAPRRVDVQIRGTDDSLLATVYSFSTNSGSTETFNDTGWQTHSVDLSAHAGTTVQIVFRQRIQQPLGGNGRYDIDAVSLSAVLVDGTPPSITPVVTGTLGSGGWYTSDVDVAWSVTDDESAIELQEGCDAASVTADTEGVTYTCTATSAGGTGSESVTVKRDATTPVVAYSGNAGTYQVDETVAITCSATDTMSGIASSTCADITGTAWSFGLGTHSFSASAEDVAGNTARASGSFQVVVAEGSLCAVVRGTVTQAGIANALCAKLDAAANARNANARRGQIGAFIAQVRAQTGKSIAPADAAALIALAEAL
jgi:hypothetical protein